MITDGQAALLERIRHGDVVVVLTRADTGARHAWTRVNDRDVDVRIVDDLRARGLLSETPGIEGAVVCAITADGRESLRRYRDALRKRARPQQAAA